MLHSLVTNSRNRIQKFTITWHTLPVEAAALKTLVDPVTLWFADRECMVTSGYDDPIRPSKEGESGLAWFIARPLLRSHWLGCMKTRPECGRFGVKLEALLKG